MHQKQFSSVNRGQRYWRIGILPILTGAFWLLVTSAAMAHHPMDSKIPSNFWEGFLSGLAHPIIEPEHFAFIVAVGLLATVKRQGILIPGAFILSAMVGTGAHILGFSLPGAELFVSGSILLFGILLAMKDSPNTFAIAILAEIAGIFHGYAYGESILGAETTPLIAYLIGFTTIQMVVAASAFAIARGLWRGKEAQIVPANLRSAGLVICGIGAAFFSSQLINAILPVPKG
jgi:urease accessory protein